MTTIGLFRPLSQLALLGIIAVRIAAADWPQWRGPERNGRSAETGLLQEWPKTGPKLLWQVNDIGSGFSTPSVVKETIYLLSNQGLSNEFVLALSTRDGSRVWSANLGKVGRPDQNPNYPAARSTPTVDGELLFALSSDGDLVCLETAKGIERWRQNLRTDFGGKPGEWAYAESPLVDGDGLICTPGGANATMLALNKRTGAVLWKSAIPDAPEAAYGSAVVGEFSGVKQYVQFLANGLVGVDAKTGTLLWRYERSAKGSPAVVMTPLVSDGCVYSGAYRAGGAVVKPVKTDGAFTVEELYFNNKLPVGLGGVVKVHDYFYGSTAQSAMCVEFKTGTIKWEERLAGAAWLYADGRLFFHSEDGEVGLLQPDPNGYREKGRFTPAHRPSDVGPSKPWAYPVVADGRLYIREQNALGCYDVKAGQP